MVQAMSKPRPRDNLHGTQWQRCMGGHVPMGQPVDHIIWTDQSGQWHWDLEKRSLTMSLILGERSWSHVLLYRCS